MSATLLSKKQSPVNVFPDKVDDIHWTRTGRRLTFGEFLRLCRIVYRIEEKRRSGLLVGQCLRDQANGFLKPSGKPMSGETRRKKMRVIERAREVCSGV